MRKRMQLIAAALTLALITGGCQPSVVQYRETTRQTIVVYSFSVEEEVMTEEVFPAFRTYWREQMGQEVIFQSVFASSEELTRHRGLQAKAQRIGNYFVLVLHKLTPPLTVALLALGEAKFDGIIGPGNVSTIIGSRAWESLLLGRNA